MPTFLTNRGLVFEANDSCFTQRKAPKPSKTCNESKEEEKEPRLHSSPAIVARMALVGGRST
jgi:hypothetical protein